MCKLFVIAFVALLVPAEASAQCLGTNCAPRYGTQAAPRYVAPVIPPVSQAMPSCGPQCQSWQLQQQYMLQHNGDHSPPGVNPPPARNFGEWLLMEILR